MWSKSQFSHKVRGARRSAGSLPYRKDNRRVRLSFEWLEDRFLLSSAPIIQGIWPQTGPVGGGTSVVISGEALTEGSTNDITVDFGKTPAKFSINTDTGKITATSPADTWTAGGNMVDVTVTTDYGPSASSSADQFTYYLASRLPTSMLVTSLTDTDPSLSGEAVILTATVSCSGYVVEWPNEGVDFYDTTAGKDLGSGILNESGQASLVVPAGTLAVGYHAITASYSGDVWYAGSTSPPWPQVVGQADGLIVTSAADPATLTPGTLRYVLKQANGDAGARQSDTIVFNTSQMRTNEIFLSPANGPLLLEPATGTGSVTINGDCGGNGPITISGDGQTGVFTVDSGAQATLENLTVTGGSVSGVPGGGINNSGTLTVTNATIENNHAGGIAGTGYPGDGGGIYNAGTLTLTDVTVANNSAGSDGGGVFNNGPMMTATDTTFSENGAGARGGAICSNSKLALTASTVSGNSAFDGGGIAAQNTNAATLVDTIVAGNLETGGTGTDLYGGGFDPTSAYNLIGYGFGETGISNNNNNLVGDVVGTSGKTSPAINPLLAPLGSYGGSTQTMALLPGSPALGAGGGLAGVITADQRGIPLVNLPDIGAYQTDKVTQFSVQAQSSTVTANIPFNVTIIAENSSGVAVTDYTGPVTLTSSDGQTVISATFQATKGVFQLTGGEATVSVMLDMPNTVTLTATAGKVSKNKSDSIVVNPATVAKINVSAGSWNAIAGVPFTVTITAVDAGGSTCLDDNQGVVLTAGTQNLYKGSGNTLLDKNNPTDASITLKKGSATVTMCLHTAGDGSLKATQGSATPGTWPMTVYAGNPAKITASVQTQGGTAGKPGYVTAGVGFWVTVAAADAYGNPTDASGIPLSSVKVKCSDTKQKATMTQSAFTVYSGTPAILTGTCTLTLVETSAVTLSVTATLPNGTSVPSPATAGFTVIVGPPAKLQFLKQPSNVAAGAVISPWVTVEVTDGAGNPVTSDKTDWVTVAVVNSSDGGGVCGTTLVQVVAGIATFSNLMIDKGGTGYTLVATSGNLQESPPSKAFNVSATAQWTVLAYLDGDNTLETWLPIYIEEMEQVGSTPWVNIVAQVDRGSQTTQDANGYTDLSWYGCRQGEIIKDPGDTTMASLPPSADMGQVDMGNPATLTSFIQWGCRTSLRTITSWSSWTMASAVADVARTTPPTR